MGKSILIKSECKHHGVTDFYHYPERKTNICATCIREKRRARYKDPEKRKMDLNYVKKWNNENKDKVEELSKLANIKKKEVKYRLSSIYYEKHKNLIDLVFDGYKLNKNKNNILKAIGKVDHESQFIPKLFEYAIGLHKSVLLNSLSWKYSSLVKYYHGVRETYEDTSAELKEKIKNETRHIVRRLMRDKSREMNRHLKTLVYEKIDVSHLMPVSVKEPKLKFIPKVRNIENSQTGYKGVKQIRKSAFVASYKGKVIGEFPSAELAAVAYNREALVEYGENAISAGVLNKINKNVSYLGCKGVTLRKWGGELKYTARLEHKNIEVLNQAYETIEDAMKAYDKKVVEIYGSESDKLNYRTENVIEYIDKDQNYRGVKFMKRITKNKGETSSYVANYKKYLGSFRTAHEAAIRYNNAVIAEMGESEAMKSGLLNKFKLSYKKKQVNNTII